MTDNAERPRRGRPPVDEPKPRKNVSLEPDIQELLGRAQDQLEAQFGFRPTLSQTVRHILRVFSDAGAKT